MADVDGLRTKQAAKHRFRRARMIASCAAAATWMGATAGLAADTKPPKLSAPPQAFQDLPGVRPQGEMTFGSPYSCETVIRMMKSRDAIGYRGEGMPVRVYRCTKDGAVYESLNPPTPSGGWYPGVNPRVIDR